MGTVVPYSPAYQSRVDNYWSLSLSLTGIREINRFNLRRMRDRARHLERENVLAGAILDRCCDNVIGTGLDLLPDTPDATFNAEILDHWQRWKDTAEITGRYDFAQWQWMFYRSHLRDGDCGTVLVSRGDDASLQLLSGDYIDSLSTALLDNVTHVHGMELGSDQQPVKYHVKTASDTGSWTESVVPARNMVFYPRVKQTTDYRGEPLFAPIFVLLEQMDRYREAEVIKKRIEACNAIFVKKPTTNAAFQNMAMTTNAEGGQQPTFNFEPGLVHYLMPGEDIASFQPSQGEQNFPGFIRCLAGFLGLNCGLTLNMLLLDYTGMSYTAGKMGSLQSNRHFQVEQNRFKGRVLRRVYQWWLAKEVKAGRLMVPTALQGNYWQHRWIPAGFPLLDPNKEVAAALAEIDAGFATWSDIVLSRGHDFAALCARRARDQELLKANGISTSRSTLTRDQVLAPGVMPTASGPTGRPAPDADADQDEDRDNED
jgi:lambda family phage portal protein